jgi:hypothetical protein
VDSVHNRVRKPDPEASTGVLLVMIENDCVISEQGLTTVHRTRIHRLSECINNRGAARPSAFVHGGDWGIGRNKRDNSRGDRAGYPFAIVNKGPTKPAKHRVANLNALDGPFNRESAYSAIRSFAARELDPRRIRVNAVCPGQVVTDMATRSTSSEGIAVLAAQVPVGRIGSPEDIASVIAFLASKDAGYMAQRHSQVKTAVTRVSRRSTAGHPAALARL